MDPFTLNGRFCFPDEIFPAVSEDFAAEVPVLPTILAAELEAQFQDIKLAGDTVPTDKLFLWVQKILKLADLYGLGSPRAIEYAKHVLETTAPSTSPYAGLASYYLGCYYQTGILGFDCDTVAARTWLRRAIKLRYARAWYRIATNAETRRDMSKALSRYNQGAALDDAACLYRLAIAHFLGQFGMPRDISKAFNLLEVAARRADADYPHPAFLLGKLCLGEAELVPGLHPLPPQYIDKARGYDLMRKAALLDFSPAQMRLADAYQGELAFESTVTMRFLHLSCRQERYLAYMDRPSVLHGAPETLLVKWFLCGFEPVFSPNEQWAFNFGSVAAQLGAPTAIFAMGYFYEVGITVPANWVVAKQFYEKSAKAGCAAAVERLRKSDLPTREPSLRRQLTRVDHERTLSKYRARLGDGVQPSKMVVDSLDASPQPSPEPQQQPQLPSQLPPQVPPQLPPQLPPQSPAESPVLAPVPRSPPKLPYPDERSERSERRRSFFGAAKDILSSLPYPKSRSPSPKRPAYPLSTPSSPEKLPYPEDEKKPSCTPYPDSPPSRPSSVTRPIATQSRPISSVSSMQPVAPVAPVAQPMLSTPLVEPVLSSPLAQPVLKSEFRPPSTGSNRSGSGTESGRLRKPVRRKPVSRAVSGPVPAHPPQPTHARSQTVSIDPSDIREWTPSPTRSRNTPSPSGRRPPQPQVPPPQPPQSAKASPLSSTSIPSLPPASGSPISRHRKAESVALPSSSPPRSQRRLASSPVSNRSTSPVKRPGVAYTFEEMGVPVIAGDNTGKCIIS